jgi:hypothetical protein
MSHHHLPAVPTPLAPGTVVGAYTLVACRGEDLDGFVYDAVETLGGRAVTIREGCPVGLVERVKGAVLPLAGAEADWRDWLVRWTRLVAHWQQVTQTADLAHLGRLALVRIEDRGEANGTAWACLPAVTGRSLRQVVEFGGGGPDRVLIDAGLQACCDAVEPLHRLGEVHGNLTPEQVSVLDGGAWSVPLPDSDPSRQPLSPWLAPEQTEAGRAAGLVTGPWTDVHAIAALAHWLLTGSAPPSLSRRQADEPGCWAALERVETDPLRCRAWRSALALAPADRLGSVAALRMALGWSERPVPQASPPRPPPPPLPEPAPATVRRDRFSPVALVGLLVSLALGFGVLWLNREAPPLPPPPLATPEVVTVTPPTPPPTPSRVESKPTLTPAPAAAAAPPAPAKVVRTPPIRPAAPAPAPAPTPAPAQKNRSQPSEACIEWLRRRSLEPAGPAGEGPAAPSACQ